MKSRTYQYFKQLALFVALCIMFAPSTFSQGGTRPVIEDNSSAQCCPPEGPCHNSSNDVTRTLSVPMNSKICWPKGGTGCSGYCTPNFVAVCSSSGWWKSTSDPCEATDSDASGGTSFNGGEGNPGDGGPPESSVSGSKRGIYGVKSPYQQPSPYNQSGQLPSILNGGPFDGGDSDYGFVVPPISNSGSLTRVQECSALRAQIQEAERYVKATCPYAAESNAHRTACQVGKATLNSNQTMYQQKCF